VSAIPVRELDKALATVAAESSDVRAPRPSQATALVQLAIEAGADLSRNVAGEGFVTVMVGGHREKNVLAAKLRYRDQEEPVGLRVAECDGRLYLDLCDRERRAVEVGPDGWRVIDNPPVRFWRAPGMLPLPAPERGGSIDCLRQFLNVRTGAGGEDPRFIMAVARLLAALHPRGAVSGLGACGRARVGEIIIRPSAPEPRRPEFRAAAITAAGRSGPIYRCPKRPHDCARQFERYIKLAFRQPLSACYRGRLCYTAAPHRYRRGTVRRNAPDHCERDRGYHHPVRSADRTIFLTLDEIPEDRRQQEHELWCAFEAERPRILEALLDAVARGLTMLAATKLTHRPRMADFARWVAACEGALWTPGTFTAAYGDNRHAAIETALAANPVATAVRSLMAERDEWEGTATELLATLAAAVTDAGRRDRKWPGNGQALLGRLRRVTPELRHIGITFAQAGVGRTRIFNTNVMPRSEQKFTAAAAMACASGACSRPETVPDSGFARPSIAPTERGVGLVAGPAIEIEFPDGARVSITASSPVPLAQAVVKALSCR
jgi:hypothetical protein